MFPICDRNVPSNINFSECFASLMDNGPGIQLRIFYFVYSFFILFYGFLYSVHTLFCVLLSPLKQRIKPKTRDVQTHSDEHVNEI